MNEPLQSSLDSLKQCVLETQWSDIPAPAREAAAVFLMDSVSVGISGYATETAAAVRAAVVHWGEGNQCTVLGGPERLPPGAAAYVNAFQVHCQEFDCLHEPATVHAMAVVTGALLALGEERAWSGEELLLGVVLGVEVAVSLGLAATRGLTFFRPATAGAMGACAALARLEGFPEERFEDAMGLVYSQLAGTMQAHVEGSVALPLQVAVAARAAVNSIELAREGLAGPHDVLDGPFGYFTLFEPGAEPGPVFSRMGRPWHVTGLSHKPFPTGRAAHGTLEGLQRLINAQGIDPGEIHGVEAHVPPLIERLVARPYRAQMTVNYARLCLQYLVPVFLRHGTVDTGCFSSAWLEDPEVARLAGRVRCVVDANPDPNALSPQRIVLITGEGKRWEQWVPHTLGSPQNRLDADGRNHKFHHCLASAGIGGERADDLARQFTGVSDWPDLSEVLALTRPG